jgi:hypothetical protein
MTTVSTLPGKGSFIPVGGFKRHGFLRSGKSRTLVFSAETGIFCNGLKAGGKVAAQVMDFSMQGGVKRFVTLCNVPEVQQFQ